MEIVDLPTKSSLLTSSRRTGPKELALLALVYPVFENACKTIFRDITSDQRAISRPADGQEMNEMIARGRALLASPELGFIDRISHLSPSVNSERFSQDEIITQY